MYNLTNTFSVFRMADGACIPSDPANTDYAAYLQWVALGNTPTPYVAPPATTPQVVTRRQAKQALLVNGKLSLVQPAINAIANATQRGLIQIEWDDSQEFQRNRSSVIAIGTAIGLNSDGLNDLFTQAATL